MIYCREREEARRRIVEEIYRHFLRRGPTSALSELGDPQATDTLLAIIEQIDGNHERAVPLLCAALKDADGSVRFAAVKALIRIGPKAKAALPALWPLLQDKHQIIRHAVEQAIKMIDPKPAAE